MTSVQDAYDAVAEQYAALFLGDLDRDTNAQQWLTRFAELAARSTGPIADLGCGPGHVVDHLAGLGLTAVGFDISPGQIAEARNAFPASQFHVGDQAALDSADASVGGIVSRYSLIHLLPDRLTGIFDEWMRVLESGAPVLVSFFGATTADTHGTSFDHKVVTAYAFHPDTIAEQLQAAGFGVVEVAVLPPPEGGRPFDQATVLAQRPAG